MNKKQKILTGTGIAAVAIWAFSLSDSYKPDAASYAAGLFFIVVAYVGVFFILKSPPPPDFGHRLHDLYGDKVAPDSKDIIDEGRGRR